MPYLNVRLTRTSFDQDLSNKFKAHLLTFAEKYRPQTDQDPTHTPLLRKIRRQAIYGSYKTDKAYISSDCSFFIENDKHQSQRCRLHFVDHSKHAEGRFGRVLFVFAIVVLDFNERTVIVHKDPRGMPLARIKAPGKKLSDDLVHEFLPMAKYSPFYQDLNEEPYDSDCISDITGTIDLHSRIYTINLNKFNEHMSEKFKEHFLALIAKYRSVQKEQHNLTNLVKIRRQEPHGTYKTTKASFKIEHSFYIETLDNPDCCRLYFIDHTQHIDGPDSRVGRCMLILNADLKEKTLLVHKRTESNSTVGFMKCANKNTESEVLLNHDLCHEFKWMPRYSPSHPDEEKYSLCTVNASEQKLRFFMPDKGISLDELFIRKDWDKLHVDERIRLGHSRMSLIEQLCRHVARLHADGRVHRDIKPSNLLIKEVDGQYTLCLGDFAYCISKDKTRTTSGTLIYVPYEILSDTNHKKHPPSMDIYALCTTIVQFICYSDFNTFSRETYDHINQLIPYRQLKAYGYNFKGYLAEEAMELPDIYRPFINLLCRGLSLDAEERPTAKELADCIQEIAQELKRPLNMQKHRS